MNAPYQLLIDKLDEFIRKYYRNLLIKGFLYSASVVLIFFISIAVLEYYIRFSVFTRTVFFYSFICTGLFVFSNWIALPLLSLYKLGKIISHEQAAKIIGTHFKSVSDKLLNLLQLNAQKNQAPAHSSVLLIEASINQKITELKPVPFAAAIDLRKNKKYLKFALPPVLLILILLFAAPSILKDSTQRIVQHQKHFEIPSPFHFEILNASLSTVQSEDYTLNLKITGEELPESAYIDYNGSRYKLEKENKILFHHTFKTVQNKIAFRLFADGFYSTSYELYALPNPLILNFDLHLEYPSYTNKKNEIVSNTADLDVPIGTKVSWNFYTKNTKALKIRINDSSLVLLPSTENQSRFSQKLFTHSNYSIKTANEHLISKDSMLYTINIIPDLFPSIEVEEKTDSLNSKQIYFQGTVKDDYGFKRLQFNYSHVFGDSSKPYNSEIPLSKTQTQNHFFHLLDLSLLNINAGDVVEYYFEVWDNDAINGSKATRSAKKTFKAPSFQEINAAAEKKNQEIKSDLEKSLKDAKNIQKEINEFNKKLIDKKNLNWEEKKKLEELLNKQKKLQKNVEAMKQENLNNIRSQNEYKQVDERIVEKQKQLEKLFNELMSDEMKDMIKQLEKLMEELNKDKIQEALDQMKLENKDLEKELDRSLEIFKQMEFEQKFNETIDHLKKLAEKQEKLAEKSDDKKTDSKELKEKQDALNKEFNELQKELNNLEQKNKELEQPNNLKESEKEQNEIEKEMNNSSEQLQQNKNKKAADSQKKAAEKMNDLAKQMEETMANDQQEQAEEDMDALRDILENLVKLSIDQEDLMGQLKITDRNNPLYLKITQNQKKLKDDAKMIEDSLLALSKRVPQLDALINKEIGSINLNMEKSLHNLAERQSPQALNRQQYVMTSANNLALLLSEVLQQMQQQLSQQKQGQQSCSKPGSSGKPKPKPSASNMRKMQEQINKEIQKLKQQMEKEGGQPKGSRAGNRETSKELAKLAAQQEALREQMQELIKELDKKGNGGSGNLDKMSKKMEETETDLVNKRISAETLKRQQEILTKLLEAEKSEREREMDDKRQSNESKNHDYSNPSEFFEYKRLKQKEAELLKTVPISLNPFYKSKVQEYFNTIEE